MHLFYTLHSFLDHAKYFSLCFIHLILDGQIGTNLNSIGTLYASESQDSMSEYEPDESGDDSDTASSSESLTNQQARSDEYIAEKISIIGETSRTDVDVSDCLLSY